MSLRKRVLITGANGMLGSTLVKLYQEVYHVFATSSSEFGLDYFENYISFDLSLEDFSDLFNWAKPDVVIHCAALTNGNYCANNPEESLRINGLALKKLADASTKDTRIIYISTDAVFPSSLSMAKEIDCVGPESLYGKSKELGEFFLQQSKRNFTIIRTTIVGINQNPNKQGFVEWIINSSLNNEEIELFSDVLFTPISIWRLGDEIKNIITSAPAENVLHVAGSEPCTKYEFGIQLLESLGYSTKKIKMGSINNFKDRAKRATDQSLSCNLYQKISNSRLPSLKETILDIKNNIV